MKLDHQYFFLCIYKTHILYIGKEKVILNFCRNYTKCTSATVLKYPIILFKLKQQLHQNLWRLSSNMFVVVRVPRVLAAADHLLPDEEAVPLQLQDSDQRRRQGPGPRQSSAVRWVPPLHPCRLLHNNETWKCIYYMNYDFDYTECSRYLISPGHKTI